jgi:hypothetical protein
VEREVRLGETSGEDVQIVSGVQVGDVVVSKGTFSIRAERDRLGLRPLLAAAPTVPATPPPGPITDGGSGAASTVQSARVMVTDQGYEPDRVSLRVGTPARLTFVRTSDKTCGTEVTIPSLGIKRALPLNQAVDLEFTPQKSGDIAFVCGMGMLKGTIVVQ